MNRTSVYGAVAMVAVHWMGLQPAEAEAQDLELAAPYTSEIALAGDAGIDEAELAQLRLDAGVDLAPPILVTVGGGLAFIGGIVMALSGLGSWGIGLGSLGSSGGSPNDDGVIFGGLAMAGVGALAAIAGGIWTGIENRRRRRARRALRDLELSVVPHGLGVGIDLRF